MLRPEVLHEMGQQGIGPVAKRFSDALDPGAFPSRHLRTVAQRVRHRHQADLGGIRDGTERDALAAGAGGFAFHEGKGAAADAVHTVGK